VTVLVSHDPGCKYARPEGGGHSDAAKRLSDTYNLHRAAAGFHARGVFAAALADGTSDGILYDSRADAVRHQHHNEQFYAYIRLGAPSMTVCAAESVMRFQRHGYELARRHVDREDRAHGGREIIPRLTNEDQERQIRAMRGLVRLPIALGHGKE
jgi:hypothetical protein